MAETSALPERHELPLRQLERQPTGVDGEFADRRAVSPSLLELDSDGGAVGGLLCEQVALEHHVLVRETADVDPLCHAHGATGFVRGVLVHGDEERPFASRVAAAANPDCRPGAGLPAVGCAVVGFLEPGVREQVAGGELGRRVGRGRDSPVRRVEVQVTRSAVATSRVHDPGDDRAVPPRFRVPLRADGAGRLSAGAPGVAAADHPH